MLTIIPRSSVSVRSKRPPISDRYILIGVDDIHGYLRIEPVWPGEDPFAVAKMYGGVVIADHLYLYDAVKRAKTLLGIFSFELEEIPTPTKGYRFEIPEVCYE